MAPITIFRDDAEAIALANGSQYGLKAAVQSRSFDHAVEVGSRLQAGAVHINEPTIGDEAVVPFPAIKASGNGAIGGPANVEEFTRWQWVTQRREQVPTQMGGA